MSTLKAPASVPTPTDDADQLRKAFVGLGTNEQAIISILAHRAPHHRRLIRQIYAETYDEDLLKSLDKEISGDFEWVVLLWTQDAAERDAWLANEAAMRFRPGNHYVLVEIAYASSSNELFAVRQEYHARFKRSLEEDVAAHTSGDFRKVLAVLPSLKGEIDSICKYLESFSPVNLMLLVSTLEDLRTTISKCKSCIQISKADRKFMHQVRESLRGSTI